MRVYPLGRVESLAAITSDRRTQELVRLVEHETSLLGLLFQIIRRFHKTAELAQGRREDGFTLGRMVSSYRVSTLAQRTSRRRIGELIEELYTAYAPGEGNVRGAILEALVELRLRRRYGETGDLLENNLRFALFNGTQYSTKDQSIDVIGFDGAVGECHDCKVNAGRFCPDWVLELQREVAPFGFKIGLVTVGGASWARKSIAGLGIALDSNTVLVGQEDFHPLMPLQADRHSA